MKLRTIPSLQGPRPTRESVIAVALLAGAISLALTPLQAAPDGSGATQTKNDDTNVSDPDDWFTGTGESVDRSDNRPGATGNTPARNRVGGKTDRSQDQRATNRRGNARGGPTEGVDTQTTTGSTTGATETLEGTIEGFQRVHLETESASEQHSFVSLRLRNGENKVVALGTRLNVADLDLKRGDTVSISGQAARLDDRDVLVATRLMVDDELYRVRDHEQIEPGELEPARNSGIQRPRRTTRGNAVNQRPDQTGSSIARDDNRNPGSPREAALPDREEMGQEAGRVTVTGTIDEHRRVRLSGRNQQTLIVRLEMEDGDSLVADLGINTSLDRLGLENGAEIEVEGRRTTVDGRELIVAEMLRADGKSTRLQQLPRRDEDDDATDSGRTGPGTRLDTTGE